MDQRAGGKSGVTIGFVDSVQISGALVARGIFARKLAIGTTTSDFKLYCFCCCLFSSIPIEENVSTKCFC
jgi:hypothetical protein